mmetsp:Transcript_31737/g.83445  ORF Transcript_31737/g.83445 Transcript_31737/m.83445 type:complete len:116 (+) Transcript_31737:832-1179(+)
MARRTSDAVAAAAAGHSEAEQGARACQQLWQVPCHAGLRFPPRSAAQGAARPSVAALPAVRRRQNPHERRHQRRHQRQDHHIGQHRYQLRVGTLSTRCLPNGPRCGAAKLMPHEL